jgi:hypothetical protein
LDNATLVTIMWGMLGAAATAALGLFVWGVKALVTTTFENTVQIKILNSNFEKFMNLPAKMEKFETDLKVAHDRIREVYKNGG